MCVTSACWCCGFACLQVYELLQIVSECAGLSNCTNSCMDIPNERLMPPSCSCTASLIVKHNVASKYVVNCHRSILSCFVSVCVCVCVCCYFLCSKGLTVIHEGAGDLLPFCKHADSLFHRPQIFMSGLAICAYKACPCVDFFFF
jgi:hypothetical protein